MSVLFAGAGTAGNQAVGATGMRGYAPEGRTHSPENFASAIYLKLGIAALHPGR